MDPSLEIFFSAVYGLEDGAQSLTTDITLIAHHGRVVCPHSHPDSLCAENPTTENSGLRVSGGCGRSADDEVMEMLGGHGHYDAGWLLLWNYHLLKGPLVVWVCNSGLNLPPMCSIWMTSSAPVLWWAKFAKLQRLNKCGKEIISGWAVFRRYIHVRKKLNTVSYRRRQMRKKKHLFSKCKVYIVL
ncbi:hypothetical protein F2P81_011597 [Xyrichtys novacula]|uniref:Uncharacterized protein n=1 Tax=Xyrichtys novacula TaxID=13765 RepID=A0AAV1HJJ1_XYRNO|nr:hypothetical protein F2P81_011597 [Xyrichtys novacula]